MTSHILKLYNDNKLISFNTPTEQIINVEY